MKKNCVIIPAFEPDKRLCQYIERIREKISVSVVVVDDGSGPKYRPVFDCIGGMEECVVLRHDVNRGKGRALKTAFAYVLRRDEEIRRVVCADCDGQHAAEDVSRIFRAAEEMPGALHLGGRDFSQEDVPFRSRFGNRITSCLFWLVCGKWIDDTQTGLRAFDKCLLPEMLSIPGERFEYETQMLLACVRDKIPIRVQRIQTIYTDGNEGSHFRPVKDSICVLRILFSEVIRFGMSSVFCAALDLFLFWLFLTVGWQFQGQPAQMAGGGTVLPGLGQITAATALARLISAGTNYMLNRKYVFRRKGRGQTKGRSILRYLALCAGLAAASSLSVFLVNRIFLADAALCKVLSDTVLFFVSYKIQKSWVFAEAGKEKEADGSD